MATEETLRSLIDPPGTRWDFPRIDDRTPEDTSSDEAPRRAPRIVRLGVSAGIGIAALSLVVAAVGVVGKSHGTRETIPLAETADSPGVTVDTAGPTTLVVHVSGAVATPGLVTLQDGDRVDTAILAAGGATTEADLSAINLARYVVDGEHLIVPREGETIPSQSLGPSGKVSLSIASATELETLPGVGPALAQRIIDWRTQHGAFRHVEDVTSVPGIGPATLDRFRDLVVP